MYVDCPGGLILMHLPLKSFIINNYFLLGASHKLLLESNF